MAEAINRRVFAALQMVDAATGQMIFSPIQLQGEGANIFRNKSGFFVIKELHGASEYSASFETPAAPPVGSMELTLSCQDPKRKYLERTLSLSLPRDANPANSDNADSLFNPLVVELYRDVHAKTLVNWSLVRVVATDSGEPVVGAFIQVVRLSDDQLIGRSISNQQGEALVIIPGIPITEFSEGDDEEDEDDSEEEEAVVIQDINVRVELSLADPPQWPVNPDVLQSNHAANIEQTINTSLRTGRTEIVRFAL
ncbi:hypothetical protein SAMN02745866_01751 [Alteromonadaceae bacterium Bs31]|nr:hypothetical protein SAMN02745866_01751 [Alteromonadaceae bacterium Bs31]